MNNRIAISKLPWLALVLFAVAVGIAAEQSKPGPEFPAGFKGVEGWVTTGAPRKFVSETLYGYVDGGAEIILQYGFKDLTVFDLVPKKPVPGGGKKEITVEFYRMESPKAAFGIFSTRREGNERTSPGLRTVHWFGKSQAALAKGPFYVNVLITGCTESEVEEFILALDREMPPDETFQPQPLLYMPRFSLVPGSERYIRGPLAAANESPLLGVDLWGFEFGTEAYSAKYQPGESKLVVIRFSRPTGDLTQDVTKLFSAYLSEVSMYYDYVAGKSLSGEYYLFGQYGSTGALILGEPDPNLARARLKEALDKAAKEAAPPEKK
jgi:Family of unknown function (DUF6599)